MILKDLNHENIVGFRGFVERGDGDCVLVMEDGQKSLTSMIEERSDCGLGECKSQCKEVACLGGRLLTFPFDKKRQMLVSD